MFTLGCASQTIFGHISPSFRQFRIFNAFYFISKVVINCSIPRGLNYHKARPNFHQWRDTKQHVYGLSFASLDEAEAFAAAVEAALEQLAALKRQQSSSQTQELQSLKQQLPGNGPTVTNHQFQQQSQPQQQVPQYRELQSHYDQSSHAESGRTKRTATCLLSVSLSYPNDVVSLQEEVESPGYAGISIQQKTISTNVGANSRGEYAMPNTAQLQQQQQIAPQSDLNGGGGGYRAPSILSDSGRSVNGSIGNGSVDGR
ncbi:unnamed protein product [Hydatigera taeniaeformis]|uniref:WH1 domain-containing protein n=1 Tax=Hydatigena taeniaeformis TaxID=6205 RepID=A0A0R3WYE5_HYDTA|nr:unnamed protein product [Hydatigera taeniaeformis]